MKKIIYILIFSIIIAAPLFTWAILSKMNESNPKIMETLDFDLNEKRLKATLSETINMATITSDLEKYYNDRIPYRSVLISSKRYIDESIEKPYKNSIEMKLLKLFGKKKSSENVTLYTSEHNGKVYKCFDQAVDYYYGHALIDSEIDPYDSEVEYPLRVSDNNNIIIGQSDWLYLNSINVQFFTGETNIKYEPEMIEHVRPYIELNDLCERVGKKLIIFLCPEKEEIYPEYMPTLNIVDEEEQAIKVSNYLKEHTNVTYIYPKEEMYKEKADHLIYNKYDSHWNRVGGFIGMNEVKKAMGVETTELYDEKLFKVPAENVDLISFGNLSQDALKPSFDYLFYDYKPDHNPVVSIIPNTNRAFTSTCAEGDDHYFFLIGDSFIGEFFNYVVKDFKKACCMMYTDIDKGFVTEEVEKADTIVVLLVERNENLVFQNIKNVFEYILLNYEMKLNGENISDDSVASDSELEKEVNVFAKGPGEIDN